MAYVAAPQVNLRDRIAAVYNRTGTAQNGERVEVLERSKRFVKVKTARGEIGWVEERYLAGPEVYDGLQALAAENKSTPVQATGTARSSLNIHLTPGRDTAHLVQLKEGDKVDILKRGTAERPQANLLPTTVAAQRQKSSGSAKGQEAPSPALEDWSLVRDAQGHAGWVLSRMIDVDVPLDVAQYAEGQRIVGLFVLNEVQDGDKKVPEYLMVLTEPKDGLPYDYNQVRVFTWSLKRHRYETAYIDRKLTGIFPVTVSKQEFGKEGVAPVFTLREKDDQGIVSERSYRMVQHIVRRVVAPGEEKPKPVRSSPRRRRGRR